MIWLSVNLLSRINGLHGASFPGDVQNVWVKLAGGRHVQVMKLTKYPAQLYLESRHMEQANRGNNAAYFVST